MLAAWPDRHVSRHLEHLAQVADHAGGSAGERLEAVLSAYALITYERPRGTELAALVHRGEHIARAQQQLLGFISDLIADGAGAGELPADPAPRPLPTHCLPPPTPARTLPPAP